MVVKTLKGDWRSPRNFGARTAVGFSITLVGSRGKTTLEYPFHAPMEVVCTAAACCTARKPRERTDPRPCVACRSAWPGGSRPPHPAELTRGISMDGHEGRWGAVRGALQFATRVQRHISGQKSASYVTTGIYGTFELMLHAHGRSAISSFLLYSLFCGALDLPQGAYLDFPRPREWETAADRYLTLFAAYAIQPQDILLQLPKKESTSHLTSNKIQ